MGVGVSFRRDKVVGLSVPLCEVLGGVCRGGGGCWWWGGQLG